MNALSDRELIDAAIEAGKMQRIPTGATGLVYRWDDRTRRLACVGEGPLDWRAVNKAQKRRWTIHQASQRAIVKRLLAAHKGDVDALLCAMHAEGVSYQNMGAIGVSKATAYRYCRALGLRDPSVNRQ